MAVPKKKKSKSRCGHNNSHNAHKHVNVSYDAEGNIHRSHCATKLADGSFIYKGKVILAVKPKNKKDRKDSVAADQ